MSVRKEGGIHLELEKYTRSLWQCNDRLALVAAAALVHHYIQRDNTVTRMLPGK
jgi:cytochrome b561